MGKTDFMGKAKVMYTALTVYTRYSVGGICKICLICWIKLRTASLVAGVGYVVSRLGVEEGAGEGLGVRGVSCLKSRVYVPSAPLAARAVLVARAL